MLSLWLDSSQHALAEMIPKAYHQPVCPRVKELLAAINLLQPTTRIASKDAVLDEASLKQLFAAGLFSLTVPHEHDGLDASLRDFVLVMEAIGQLGAAWAMTAVPHLCISVKAVARYAPAPHRDHILRNIRQTQQLLAFAITEDQGSDVAAMRTRLHQLAPGEFILNGRKQWITNLKRASHVVVACLCPDLHKAPGASVLVLVDLQQAGVTVSREWEKVCVNGSDTSDLFFDQVKLSKEHILTEPGQGMNAFLQMVQPGRLGTAAASIGLARRALTQAKEDLALKCTHQQALDFWVENKARLDALSSGLQMCAVFADEQAQDVPHLVSLMKFISGEMSQSLIQELDHLYAKHACDLSQIASNNRDALALFRLLKGPGEILAWQTVLAWSAVVLKPLQEKLNWSAYLQEDASYLAAHMLSLRQQGGAQQRPSQVDQLARGLAFWWLEMSTSFISDEHALELQPLEIEHAQSWSRHAFSAWRREIEATPYSLSVNEIDYLFASLSQAQERLFDLHVELSA